MAGSRFSGRWRCGRRRRGSCSGPPATWPCARRRRSWRRRPPPGSCSGTSTATPTGGGGGKGLGVGLGVGGGGRYRQLLWHFHGKAYPSLHAPWLLRPAACVLRLLRPAQRLPGRRRRTAGGPCPACWPRWVGSSPPVLRPRELFTAAATDADTDAARPPHPPHPPPSRRDFPAGRGGSFVEGAGFTKTARQRVADLLFADDVLNRWVGRGCICEGSWLYL